MNKSTGVKQSFVDSDGISRNKVALVMLSNFLLTLSFRGESSPPEDFDAYIKNYLTIRIPRQIGVRLATYKVTREVSLELFNRVLNKLHEFKRDTGKANTTSEFNLLLDAVSQTATEYLDYVKISSHKMDLRDKNDTESSHFIDIEIKEGSDTWLYQTINGEHSDKSKPKKNGVVFDVESHSNSLDNYLNILFSFISGFVASEKIQLELTVSLQRNPDIILQAKKTAMILGGDYRYYLILINHLNVMRFRQPDFLQQYAADYIHSNYKWDYDSSVRVVEEVLKKAVK